MARSSRRIGTTIVAALAACAAGAAVTAPGAEATSAWLPAHTPSEPTSYGDATAPSAISPAGDVTVVWLTPTGANAFDLIAATKPAGGAWEPAARIASAADNPKITVDAQGRFTVVYEEVSPGQRVLRVTDRTPTEGWREPVTLAGTVGAAQHSLATTVDGTTLLTFMRSDFTRTPVRLDLSLATRAPGANWTMPEQIDSVSGYSSYSAASIRIDRVNGGYAVYWGPSTSGGPINRFRIMRPDGRWAGPAEGADRAPAGSHASGMEFDRHGNLYVLWNAPPEPASTVEGTIRGTSGTWMRTSTISVAPLTYVRGEMTTDAGNEMIAVLGTDVPSGGIRVATLAAGTTDWSAPQTVTTAPATIAGAFTDSGGTSTVVARVSDGSIVAFERPRTGAWRPAGTLHAKSSWLSSLNANAAGDVVMTTSETAPGDSRVLRIVLGDNSDPRLTALDVPASAAPGRAVAMSAAPFDAISGVASTTWDFGDGATAAGTQVSHTYAKDGTYQVTVTVVDNVGRRSSTSRTIVVGTGGPSGGTTAQCPTRPRFNSVIYRDGVTSFYYRPLPGQSILGARRFGNRLPTMLRTPAGRSRLPRVEYTTDRVVDARRLPWFARKVGPRRVVTAIMSNADAAKYSGIRLAYRPKRGTYAKLILPTGSVRTLRANCPRITGYKTIYAQNIFVTRRSK